MELLVKETLELRKKRDILFPYYVGYTFFKESDYQGKITHKEAILAGYPIEVNEEMMEGTELTAEDLFMEGGVYEEAFFNEFHGTKLSKTDFNLVNERFFPSKDKLIIYSWNTEFTNYFNYARVGWGAYLWSVYDPRTQIFTIIEIFLAEQG
ncbi:hypothetical protein B835_1811 [Enterococcus mundtii 3F]|uniref:hypothetical protein n=1 Tax=Enterococcus mundtii TaxID=53346 RepID=UPI002303406E|nr:hypothetical protein [Enterococcus mundtii]MDA9461884.1 hypothetical protein [Enterococcus mundtii 3F]